jgi:Kef-type K+ transport system membrane component KefB
MTPFVQFLLVLSIIVAGAKAGGWLASRLRQPAVVGEILVGLLLGPSVLDMLGWPILANLHDPYLLSEVVSHLAELGVICLMFLAGLEIELPEMLRTGRVAVTTGISDVIVTFGLVSLATFLFGYPWPEAAFVGVALTATSVSISAQTLLELGKLRSREGLVLLGTAVVDDVLDLLLLSAFIALAAGTATPGTLLLVLVRMVGYLAAAGVLGFVLLPRLAAWVERQPISEGLAALVLVTVLLFALSAEVVGGLAAIMGAFLAGLGFGRSNLRGEIARRIHTITYSFLVPIFFVSIGLRSNLRLLGGGDILVAAVLALVAILSKVLGCGLGARLGGFSNRQAVRVGIGMISRGEVGLIVAAAGMQAGLIGTSLFSVVTFIVLVTTLVTPILLRLAFRNKEASHA